MRITKVEGNVKKGFDGEIGAKTLVVGPNGSGKSTIVNIVELALTGRAGDIAGRDVAREVDVMSLAANGTSELRSQVTFDDGMVAAYYTSGSTAKAKKATGDKPPDRCHEDVLPIRTVSEALLASPATARKFLLAKMGGGLTRDSGAPDERRDLFDILMRVVPTSFTPAEALVAVLEKAGEKSREAAAAAKAAKTASSFVTQGAAAPPSKDEIATALREMEEAQKLYQSALRSNEPKPLDELVEKHDALLKESDYLVEKYQQVVESLERLQAPQAPLHPKIHEIVTVAKESSKAGACLVCGTEVDGSLVDTIREVEEQIADSILAWKQKNELEVEQSSLMRQAARLSKEIDAIWDEKTKREAEGEQEAVDPVPLQIAYDAARQRYTDLTVQANSWESSRKAKAQEQEAEEESKVWKKLKDDLEDKIALLLEVARTKFILRVQSYLPATDRFDLRLKDGDREVVQFGLVREGHLHTALSGAEWARVIAALSSACVPDGKYACIIPEERAFDAVTLGKVMRALGESPHQVILTSPVAPKSPPKDWVIIRRGEEE